MKSLSLVLSFLLVATVVRAQEEQLPTAPPADAQAVQKINALGGGAMPLAANTNLLSVNFSLAGSKIDDAALESLKGVGDQLVWLNLANTSVTDAGLKVLAGFKNLRRLHLEKTGVGDEGLASVKGLAELQYLNLYGTKVTDKGVASLGGLKKLKNVYLWQTAVTDGGAAELAKALPGLYINRGIDPPAKVVEIAAPAPAPAVAAAKPINAKCPLSGKDVDAAKISVYKTQTIGFCCDNCKGKFDAEPAKFIGKVAEFKEPAEKKEEKKEEKKDDKKDGKKAINTKCPLSDKDIDAAVTFTYKGQAIGFCCKDCCGKFAKEPEKYIEKVKEFKKEEKKEEKKSDAGNVFNVSFEAAEEVTFDDPINKKCPITGKDVNPTKTVEYEKQLIGLCCDDCKGKFEADPKKYIGKVPEFKKGKKKSSVDICCCEAADDPINKKCPITGKDVNPTKTVEYEKQLIGLCCDDCKGKFEADPKKYIGKVPEFKKGKKKSSVDEIGFTAEEITFDDPINKKCPITGKDVNPTKTVEYEKQLIGLCCDDCKGKFEADPKKYIGKVPEFKKGKKKSSLEEISFTAEEITLDDPINKKCPITGKDVNPTKTVEYEKQLIGLCCDDCKGKFEADPKKYIGKVPEFKKGKKKSSVDEISFDEPINKKCPFTGKELAAGRTVEYKKQTIGFCCADCVAKFEGDPEKYIKKVKEFKKSSRADD